jgi:hypothetical protein
MFTVWRRLTFWGMKSFELYLKIQFLPQNNERSQSQDQEFMLFKEVGLVASSKNT